MQPNERRLIEDLFARLRGAEGQSRDPEIERLIAAELQRAPHATYAMAQTIIAQNQALEAAAARIEELEGGERYEDDEEEENEPVRGAMGAPNLGRPGAGRGSVPAFGRGAAAQQPPQQQGGGFLANAGQVALGVAGGMLLGEAAKTLLGSGSEAQAATGAADTASAASPLSQDAGSGDVGGDVGGGAEEGGGGGLFGWLFGGDTSQDNNADHDSADNGWDDGGDGDSGGD